MTAKKTNVHIMKRGDHSALNVSSTPAIAINHDNDIVCVYVPIHSSSPKVIWFPHIFHSIKTHQKRQSSSLAEAAIQVIFVAILQIIDRPIFLHLCWNLSPFTYISSIHPSLLTLLITILHPVQPFDHFPPFPNERMHLLQCTEKDSAEPGRVWVVRYTLWIKNAGK